MVKWATESKRSLFFNNDFKVFEIWKGINILYQKGTERVLCVTLESKNK